MTKNNNKKTGETIAPVAKRPWLMWVVSAGLIMVLIGTLMPLVSPYGEAFRYVYTAGAVLTLAGRLFSPYRGDNVRVKRLSRIEAWSSVFFCAAAFFMFYPGAGNTDWLAFTMAGGAIQIYTSIMIPRALKATNY